jgi:hypothetical protein
MNFAGLLVGLLFLVVGLLELALASRFLYPVLRQRHELAKLTQTQGIKPTTVMALIRFQSLVLLPILGVILGMRMKIGVSA